MYAYFQGNATSADVRAAYALVLAREPENDDVVEFRRGYPLLQIVVDLITSEEFYVLAERIAVDEHLPHEKLTSAHLQAAAVWMSHFMQSPNEVASVSWWTLIESLFEQLRIAGVTLSPELDGFMDVVSKKARQAGRKFDRLRPLFTFDIEWYLKRNEKARLATANGVIRSADEYFLSDGIKLGQQILPAFSENLKSCYDAIPRKELRSIHVVLSWLLSDSRIGRVSHWLFSSSYYAEMLDWQDISSRDDGDADFKDYVADGDTSYLGFLESGDRLGYSPHPLFCPYAYSALSPRSETNGMAPFRDYVTNGMFCERRTSAIFDNDYYLISNADARYALLSGTHVSALHHFLTVGIFKDLPFSPDFDLGFYRNEYQHVSQSANAGNTPSVTFHFVYQGIAAGDKPNPYFDPSYYRQRHPHAIAEMKKLGIRSELEHFLLMGKSRDYKAMPPLVTSRPAMDAAKAIFQRRARRSFNTIIRKPIDFGPFAEHPKITIVVPVYNEFEFTARFLECAYFAIVHLKYMRDLDCELVIVNNGSSDKTNDILANCPGVRVIHFDMPIGFPRAVNAGVASALGDVIVVANNDIEFPADSLLKIARRLDACPWIGLLGGLTILPNETLQEAGSFLDSTGAVGGLGRYDDPWNEYFQGLHEADYCTGSFIAFRREDYIAVSGFDEDFSPGYYEETDFSLRLFEKLGKKAAVDSDIQINHFEHASFGKGRPPTTAYAAIRRNQARFANKHQDALSRRPAGRALNNGRGVNPLAIGRIRLLVIEDLMPDSRLGSGFVRSSHLLDALSRFGVAYDLLVLNASPVVDEFSDPRVTIYRGWMRGEDVDTVLSDSACLYSHVMVCRTHNLTRLAARLEALRHQYGFKIICDTEALTTLRILETRRQAGAVVSEDDRRAAVRLELDAPVAVAHWIAVNPYERSLIDAIGRGSTSMICHRFDRPSPQALPSFEERSRILVVGAIHEAGSPNYDGLLWFMDNIYPRCSAATRQLTLTVVGYWHPDVDAYFRARYADVPIDYEGVVSDSRLSELYSQARLALAPTRFAAGVASKAHGAMMNGVPIVLTDLLEEQLVGSAAMGASGLAVGRRDDDGASYAMWVETLAQDPIAWGAVQAAQYAAATPLAGAAEFDDGVRDLIRSAGLASRSDRTVPEQP